MDKSGGGLGREVREVWSQCEGYQPAFSPPLPALSASFHPILALDPMIVYCLKHMYGQVLLKLASFSFHLYSVGNLVFGLTLL